MTKKFDLSLAYPLPEGIRISQVFGVNPQWYPGSEGHNGVDWACMVGTEIYAMDAGTVIRADATSGKVAYGRHVRIQHAKGVSIYGHLSKLLVNVGDRVKPMQLIGLSGGATSDPASGNSTGAHLHAEYRMDGMKNPVPGGYLYNAIDIMPYLYSHNSVIVEKPDDETGVIPGKEYTEKRVNVSAWSYVNIRMAPSTSSRVIGRYLNDAPVNISSVANGWAKLYGQPGYVSNDYLK